MIDLKNCKFNKAMMKEVKIGIPIEMEHTNNPFVAERIAKQHICEFPNAKYYSQGLIPLEKKLRRQ